MTGTFQVNATWFFSPQVGSDFLPTSNAYFVAGAGGNLDLTILMQHPKETRYRYHNMKQQASWLTQYMKVHYKVYIIMNYEDD